MNSDSETIQILDEGLNELVRKYPPQTPHSNAAHYLGTSLQQDNATMTDILLQVNTETGQFAILNDDDEEIYSAVVEEWIENGDKEDNPDTDTALVNAARTLKRYIRAHKDELDNLSLLKPYSFILVDADKESVEELYIVDDETIVLDDNSLMKGLDEDLDNFFQKLMEE